MKISNPNTTEDTDIHTHKKSSVMECTPITEKVYLKFKPQKIRDREQQISNLKLVLGKGYN